MFSGIVEATGVVSALDRDGENLKITMQSSLAKDCYIDQSIAHNGVCLTVVEHDEEQYAVVAIKETLDKSNFNNIEIGDIINLERAITMDKLMDGHLVQGHVDSTITCKAITSEGGSWRIKFEFDPEFAAYLVEKGSICINGTSLTLINPTESELEVAIIPYTWEETNFHKLKAGDKCNVEFDILGKYIVRYLSLQKN